MIKVVFEGALLIVIGIILLVSLVLPQMHTGFTYINSTMTEMTGGSGIWPVLELLVTIGMMGSGLAYIGWNIIGTGVRGGKGRKRAA